MKYAQQIAFNSAYIHAYAAGLEAGNACTPAPMSVYQGSIRVAVVADGACGFAWVTVRPGNSSFARWLVKQGHARKAYAGGVEIWMRDFNQSMTRKAAMAEAMAAHLTTALGLDGISWGSRED